uniref:Uncharacterized protein n=1 Tax=Vespula pensylvanica TaxID=30213 RepID=A0A834UBL4_VESPE|nr:hypothetical protein H0235_005548 [Vespula pensylvanica]
MNERIVKGQEIIRETRNGKSVGVTYSMILLKESRSIRAIARSLVTRQVPMTRKKPVSSAPSTPARRSRLSEGAKERKKKRREKKEREGTRREERKGKEALLFDCKGARTKNSSRNEP